MSPDVLDLLPFRLRRASVILLGFAGRARFMSWTYIVQVIWASKLKSSDVLGDPFVTYRGDLSLA